MDRPPRDRDSPYTQSHTIWLFVSSFFGLKYTFIDVAKLTLFRCPDFTHDLGFPLGPVLNRLFHLRAKRISRLADRLDRLAYGQENGVIGCDNLNCRDSIYRYLKVQRHHIQRLLQKDGGSFDHAMKNMNKKRPWTEKDSAPRTLAASTALLAVRPRLWAVGLTVRTSLATFGWPGTTCSRLGRIFDSQRKIWALIGRTWNASGRRPSVTELNATPPQSIAEALTSPSFYLD